jgi:type IV secretion system protein VirB6
LALGLGRTAFIASLFAGFGFLRLFGGLLLAMVPFFAAFLLFGQMRWLFMGWLRSMIAVFLGSLFAAVIVGVELAILEPWLVNVLAQRAALRPAIEAPFEFFALTLSFAIILFSTLAATTWLCFSTNVTLWVEQRVEQWRGAVESGWAERQVAGLPDRGDQPAPLGTNRGLAIARSVAMIEQRAGQGATPVQPAADRRTPALDPVDNRVRGSLEVTPLGQSYKRTARRVSASATRRSATT